MGVSPPPRPSEAALSPARLCPRTTPSPAQPQPDANSQTAVNPLTEPIKQALSAAASSLGRGHNEPHPLELSSGVCRAITGARKGARLVVSYGTTPPNVGTIFADDMGFGTSWFCSQA